MSQRQQIARAIQHFNAERFDQAEAIARESLRAAPRERHALNLLAVIACRRGDFETGIDFALQVLANHPDDIQALELLGDALHSLQRFADAADAFSQAAAIRPDERRLLAKQGYALHEAGAYAAAVAAYTHAIALRGAAADLHLDCGKALVRLNRIDDAESAFRQAVAVDPDCGLGWKYIAEILTAKGQLTEASSAYRRALLYLPDDTDCHFNLARMLNDLGRFDEALGAIDRAIALKPDFAEAHSNRSAALRQLGRFPEAVAAARQAIAIKPDHANALSNLGNALTALGRLEPALKVHLRAVELAPERGNILANLALTLQEMGAEADAMALLERAVALDSAKAWPQFNLALIRLKNGDFDRGWAGYRWRWMARSRGARENEQRQPRWDGQALSAGCLMIWSEQGIGDEIMFAGFIPQLLASGVTCGVECDPRLVPLLRRSFPTVAVVARGDTANVPPDIPAHVYAGDLPGLLRPDRHASPWFETHYLTADPTRTADLRSRYGTRKPLIGLAWYSANPITGGRRSIALEQLKPLLASDELTWVSLQYGDLQTIGRRYRGQLLVDPEIDQMADMDGFAAQVAAMDAVVTIDSSVVHLAGALGKPTFLLLSFDADWRWLRKRSDTPWYAGISVLRQPSPGDWTAVIEEVSCRLSQRQQTHRRETAPAPG